MISQRYRIAILAILYQFKVASFFSPGHLVQIHFVKWDYCGLKAVVIFFALSSAFDRSCPKKRSRKAAEQSPWSRISGISTEKVSLDAAPRVDSRIFKWIQTKWRIELNLIFDNTIADYVAHKSKVQLTSPFCPSAQAKQECNFQMQFRSPGCSPRPQTCEFAFAQVPLPLFENGAWLVIVRAIRQSWKKC